MESNRPTISGRSSPHPSSYSRPFSIHGPHTRLKAVQVSLVWPLADLVQVFFGQQVVGDRWEVIKTLGPDLIGIADRADYGLVLNYAVLDLTRLYNVWEEVFAQPFLKLGDGEDALVFFVTVDVEACIFLCCFACCSNLRNALVFAAKSSVIFVSLNVTMPAFLHFWFDLLF